MFKYTYRNFKMKLERNTLSVVIICVILSYGQSTRISFSNTNISSKDGDVKNVDSKTTTSENAIVLSEQELNVAGQSQVFYNETRRNKQPQNDSVNAARQLSSQRDSAQVMMSVHANVAPEGEYDPVSERPCGRHKACAVTDEESKQFRIEKFKSAILKKLHMERPPNVTALPLNSPPVQEMMRKYGINQTTQEYEYEDNVVTKDVVIISQKPPFTGDGVSEPCCHFHFTEEMMTYEAKSAWLWVYVRPARRANALLQLAKYDLPGRPNGPLRKRMFRFYRLNLSRIGAHRWKKFNVTGVVRDWMRRPAYNYGLSINTLGIANLINVGAPGSDPQNKPFLDVNLVARQNHRQKRSATCNINDGISRCCMYDLQINFATFGWDWIIFPVTYNARYCAGECSSLHFTNLRNKLIRHTDVERHGLTDCCVGTKLKPISMLYHDSNQAIVYSAVPDMEIYSCGCM